MNAAGDIAIGSLALANIQSGALILGGAETGSIVVGAVTSGQSAQVGPVTLIADYSTLLIKSDITFSGAATFASPAAGINAITATASGDINVNAALSTNPWRRVPQTQNNLNVNAERIYHHGRRGHQPAAL